MKIWYQSYVDYEHGAEYWDELRKHLDTIIDPVTARQRGASAYANFHGQAMTGPAMQTLDTQDGSLRAGGVEYFSLVADGSSKELGLRVDIPSAARPWIRIARIK